MSCVCVWEARLRRWAPMPIAGARLRVPLFLVLLIVSFAKFSRMVCNRQVVFSCIIEPLTNIWILGLRFGSMSYPYAYPFAYSCMFLILFLILVSVTKFSCKDRNRQQEVLHSNRTYTLQFTSDKMLANEYNTARTTPDSTHTSSCTRDGAPDSTTEGKGAAEVTPKISISPPAQPDYRPQQLPPPRLQGEGCASVGCTRRTQALGPNRAQRRETLRQQRPVRRDASLSTRRRTTVGTARDILARMLLAPPPLARRRRVAMWRRRWR